MKLYLISQTENQDYDSYDSAVVAAPNEEAAKMVHPYGHDPSIWGAPFACWCSKPEQVTVKLIGEALEGTEAGVVLASFNAG